MCDVRGNLLNTVKSQSHCTKILSNRGATFKVGTLKKNFRFDYCGTLDKWRTFANKDFKLTGPVYL
jgi:hypothetical protein